MTSRIMAKRDVILCRHHPKIPGVCTNDILCNTGRLNSTLSKLYWCPVVRAMTPGGSLATGQNSQQWNTAQYRYPPGIVESTASILYSSIAGWWYWFRVYQRDTSRSTCRQCKQLVFMLFFSSFYNILISVHSMHGSQVESFVELWADRNSRKLFIVFRSFLGSFLLVNVME
jgi:hypothetical protein